MSKCSVFIATSLDGFISRPDGSIDWLNEAGAGGAPGEDYGYERFMSSIDALVMGRNTFEQVLTFDGWPYGDTPMVVVSRTMHSLPAGAPSTVTLSDDSPEQVVADLVAKSLPNLSIDGGLTIQSFLAAGLIDEVTITVIPILLGTGKPLFGPLPADVTLDLVSTEGYPSGFVQTRYRVLYEAPTAE